MSALSCIFVATDACGSSAKKVSEALTKNLTENITTSVVNIARSSGAYLTASQELDFSGMVFKCKNVNIGNISQKMVAKLDFSQLAKTVDSSQLSQMLTSSLQRAVESDLRLKTAFMGGAVNTLDQSRTVTENINRIVAGYTYNDFSNSIQSIVGKQQQKWRGTVIEGENCDFGNISQDFEAQLLAKNIAETMLQRAAANASNLKIKVDEKTLQSATSSGIGEALAAVIGSIGGVIGRNLLIFVILIVVIIAAIVGVVYFATRGSE